MDLGLGINDICSDYWRCPAWILFFYTSPCLGIGTYACNCYSPNNALLHTLSPNTKNNLFVHMSDGSKTHRIWFRFVPGVWRGNPLGANEKLSEHRDRFSEHLARNWSGKSSMILKSPKTYLGTTPYSRLTAWPRLLKWALWPPGQLLGA